MNELERMLADSASRLFADAVTPARIDAMEHGLWPAELWDQVEASGLTRLFVPEADEGAQASWTEGLPVLLAGANAPAPFLDTVVAGWVLNQLGVAMPGGPIGLADLAVPVSACLHGDGWALDGAVAVPWGRYVGHVLIRAIDAETKAPLWLLAATGAAAVETGVNLANEPRDRLTFQRVPDSAAVRGDPAGWPAAPQALGALTRAIGIAGLLERILNQTVQYANERTQFGRPIGKFQAVQQQLAILANETVAARMAVASACAAVDAGGLDPGGDGRQGDLRAVRRPRGCHRASGTWGDRLHARAFAASIHAARVGLACRVRHRGVLGGRDWPARDCARRRCAVGGPDRRGGLSLQTTPRGYLG